MITKKIVNGKHLITACTLATCCLTFEKLENGNIKFTNEKNQELVCTLDEIEEMFFYLKREGIISEDSFLT
jgi:dissimilatory sulfite reductase (desulfoviridin) alpha/beta subunit